jgi:RNA polymerase sigma factor (sigma-70 family)
MLDTYRAVASDLDWAASNSTARSVEVGVGVVPTEPMTNSNPSSTDIGNGPAYCRYASEVKRVRRRAQDVPIANAFATDETGLRDAYDEYGSLVYSICRRALGAEAAKDATQEVFVSAWRAREQFDPSRGSLPAWLVGITKRRIIDNLRSERRHADRRADERPDGPGSGGAQPTVERLADRMLMADALATLSTRAREVIELAYIHDLTHIDIAERTGIPLGTIKSDIRRGLLLIREQMEASNA